MHEASFEPLDFSREPRARQLTKVLRQAIVTMRLRPGEMLSEQDLARRFGVSRSPVREALIKLSETGLVRVLPQRGTQVVKISRSGMEEARFVREALETAVVREAALKAGSSALRDLNASLTRQRQAQHSGTAEQFLALDEEFHRLLAEAAGRPMAWRTVEDVKPQLDRVRFLDMTQTTPRQAVIAQHGAIVEAIAARKPEEAEAAMRKHLGEILHVLPELAARHPELFEAEPMPSPSASAAIHEPLPLLKSGPEHV